MPPYNVLLRERLCVAAILLLTIGTALPTRGATTRQPAEVSAFHRDGQTFVTWREISDLFPDAVSFAVYAEARKQNAHLMYRVYRHTAPITSANLALASLVGEVGVGSGYNAYLYGIEGRNSQDPLKRFVIDDSEGPARPVVLGPNTGLHVHTVLPDDVGQYYYAATVVERGTENRQITVENAPRTPVAERGTKVWRPILQNDPSKDRFSYYSPAGMMYLFTRWEAEPLDSRNSAPANYMVVVFPQAKKPYKVNLSLHCWGASLVSCIPWVYYPDGVFVTSTDFPPQSWWTGWNTDFFKRSGCARGDCRGVNKYYTMTRLLSFIDWMKTRWPIDENRVMCAGNSMGGSGGKMFCLRHGETFNYVNSWVGIGRPSGSPQFATEYEALFGPESQRLLSENGVPTWEDINMARWLRANPRKETPFISFANGKNDAGIGWAQVVEFYRALRETKRAFTFRWGQGGHGERALDMAIDTVNSNAAADRLDLQRNKAMPAFTNFNLDGNPGNGDPRDGDPEGAINAFQRWDPGTIVDRQARFEIELWLVSAAPAATGTTDVTLRNLQTLATQPGRGFSWKLLQGARAVQAGTGVTDPLSLVTVPGITLRRGVRQTLVVELNSGATR